MIQFDKEQSQRLDYVLMMTEVDDAFRRKAGGIFKRRIEEQIFGLEEKIEEAKKTLEELRDE